MWFQDVRDLQWFVHWTRIISTNLCYKTLSAWKMQQSGLILLNYGIIGQSQLRMSWQRHCYSPHQLVMFLKLFKAVRCWIALLLSSLSKHMQLSDRQRRLSMPGIGSLRWRWIATPRAGRDRPYTCRYSLRYICRCILDSSDCFGCE